jgi:hypothetical protein
MNVTMTLMDTWHWRLRHWIAGLLFRASEMVNPRCFRDEWSILGVFAMKI